MDKKILVNRFKINLIIWMVLLFIISLVAVFSGLITQLYDGGNYQNSENLTYTGNQTIIRYFYLNIFSNITNAVINISSQNQSSDFSTPTNFAFIGNQNGGTAGTCTTSDNGRFQTFASCSMINETQDADIRSQFADNNIGLGSALSILKDAFGTRRGIIKFNLSEIPKNSTITEVVLNLTQNLGSNDAGQIDVVYIADDSWTETGVTWNNAPASSTTLGSVTLDSSSTASVGINFSSQLTLVQQQLDTDNILSMLIKWNDEGSNKQASFIAKEGGSTSGNTNIDSAYLRINYIPKIVDPYLNVGDNPIQYDRETTFISSNFDTNGASGVDEDWSTSTSVTGSGGVTGTFFENFTVPPKVNLANFTYKVQSLSTSINISYYNYTSKTFIRMVNTNTGGSTITGSFEVPNDGISGGTLQLLIGGFRNDIGASSIYYEGNATWFFNNTKEFQYYGIFDQKNNKTDFKSNLKDYLKICYPDTSNICAIPFNFHSETLGTLQYLDINITYTGEPLINSNVTVPSTPRYGEGQTVTIMANITDGVMGYAVTQVNFTLLAPNGTIVINNQNATLFDGKMIWNSSSYSIVNATTNLGTWRFNISAINNISMASNSSGSFSITDTTAPRIINITSPQNNSILSESTIVFNWSILDDIEVQSAWYQKDSNRSNNITFTSNNNFTTSFGLNNHNLTVFANDSSNNIVSTFVNFTILTDTTPPVITITTPLNGGTVTSTTITTTHSIRDNINVTSAVYSVYSGTSNALSYPLNTTITNPNTNTSLVYIMNLGCASNVYNLIISATDSSGLNTTVSSSYTCVTPGGGGSSVGGGGGSSPLKAINQTCISNSECSSSLCDLSKGSVRYGTCQNTLCGNGVFDTGENIVTCDQDSGLGGINLAPGFVIKFIIIVIIASFLLLLIASREGKIKKFIKWIKDVL